MIQKIFTDIFNANPIVVRSALPMRLLGEYNPYNDGWLLNTTVNKFVEVAVSKRADASIELFSVQQLEKIELGANALIDIHKPGWANTVLTVLARIFPAGLPIPGLNIMIDTGGITGGIAYTTALEAALYTALNELGPALMGGKTFDPDFHSCLFGKRGYAMKLDIRSFTHEYIPFRMTEFSLIRFIMGNRSPVSASVYRDRLCACEEVVWHLKKTDTRIHSLRDCTLPQVYAQVKDPHARRRAAFIIRENTRVIAAATNLQVGNYKAFGQKLSESDDGLMKEYEIGSPQPDWLTDELGWNENVAGTRRLTGAFSNAAFSMIRCAKQEEIMTKLVDSFTQAWNKKLIAEILATAPGIERVNSI
jgi:galactokinase